MTMRDFLQNNRPELNNAVNSALYRHNGRGGIGEIPSVWPEHSLEELRQWVLNDEGLYNWARSEGVKI